jgi:hypothetical protein
VREIRIYVEGGGEKSDTKAAIREGFSRFLGGGVRVIACGPRENALRSFKAALRDHPYAANVLLVDAEGPVTRRVAEHLRLSGQSAGLPEELFHLMVQAMEAWFLCDPETLALYYGQGFRVRALPTRQNIEEVAKDQLIPILNRATDGTTKGRYHKIWHSRDLLIRIDPAKVRVRAPHCERLFQALAALRER